jgi:hypothetical protein
MRLIAGLLKTIIVTFAEGAILPLPLPLPLLLPSPELLPLLLLPLPLLWLVFIMVLIMLLLTFVVANKDPVVAEVLGAANMLVL